MGFFWLRIVGALFAVVGALQFIICILSLLGALRSVEALPSTSAAVTALFSTLILLGCLTLTGFIQIGLAIEANVERLVDKDGA